MKEFAESALIHKKGLDPIYFEDTAFLFVGSFASEPSRDNGKHYADSRNTFWKYIKGIFSSENLSEEAYCMKYKIGVVDVVKSCWMPENSHSDNDIHDPAFINFTDVSNSIQNLKLIVIQSDYAWNIFCERFAKKINRNILILRMDSTSGVNRKKDRVSESFDLIAKILKGIL